MTQGKIVRKAIQKAAVLAVIVSIPFCFIGRGHSSEAKEQEKHTVEEGFELHLSHDVKVILNQEMKEIEDGMMKIIPASQLVVGRQLLILQKKLRTVLF